MSVLSRPRVIRHNHDTGQVEIQVIDHAGVNLWLGGPGSTQATAQMRIGDRGPDRGVHLDREAAIAIRDQLTKLIEGTAT